MPGHRRMSYGQMAKTGFLLGVGLFLIGAVGELAIQSQLVLVPAWEETLLFDFEVLGIVLFVLSPFVFGIALPLIRG